MQPREPDFRKAGRVLGCLEVHVLPARLRAQAAYRGGLSMGPHLEQLAHMQLHQQDLRLQPAARVSARSLQRCWPELHF